MNRKIVLLLIMLGFVTAGLWFLTSRTNTESEALAYGQSHYIFSPQKDDATYYWFSVGVKTRYADGRYRIISVTKNVSEGKIKRFEKALWKGLAYRKIAIGPFISSEDAKKARLIYKALIRVKKEGDLAKINAPDFGHEVYWFQIKFKESPRLRSFIFEHGPASVQSGSSKNFLSALFETLGYQQIAIGPFEDYQRTEEIKRIYRQNE